MTPKYFLELGDVMAHVEASDGALAPIAYDEGIERATALIRGQTAAGRKVIFVGNGGSAAIASHQAIDYWKNGGMRAIAFNDPRAAHLHRQRSGLPARLRGADRDVRGRGRRADRHLERWPLREYPARGRPRGWRPAVA